MEWKDKTHTSHKKVETGSYDEAMIGGELFYFYKKNIKLKKVKKARKKKVHTKNEFSMNHIIIVFCL